MNNQKLLQGFLFFFISLLVFIGLFQVLIPVAKPVLTATDYQKTQKQVVNYVALGDSLTQGVGDTTNQGGFVPLLAQNLTNQYGWEVSYANYGVSGNTSSQILKRMENQEEIADSLAKADFMTLTVGGNDLRKVILDNIASLKVSTFTKPAKSYSKRLKTIIETARKDNPDLPIYVLGIYNPYYLTFPEMTDMQTIVDNWNATTEKTVTAYDKVYFVPINDLLYQGIDGQEGVADTTAGSSSTTNNVLYSGDNFHPNNTGYEIMKQAVMEKISETKEEWAD